MRRLHFLVAIAIVLLAPALAAAQVVGVTADTVKIGGYGALTGPYYLYGKLVMNASSPWG